VTELRVISVDPGIAEDSCGFARVGVDGHRRTLVDYRTLWLDKLDTAEDRMRDVTMRVSDELACADLIVLEDQQPDVHHARGHANKHSARLQQLVRMLEAVALVMSKPSIVVTPRSVRTALGLPANATKVQMWNTVRLAFLKTRSDPKSLHVRDAIVLAVAGEKIWRVGQQARRSA
jgi:Holliday junction resolvasome RuvABC endonuclease subunit